MAHKRLDVPLKIKSVSETGEFAGYGSVFGVEDAYGDVVVAGAFQETLEEWKGKSRLPAMLWQHDSREPIGVYTKMEEDENGLYLEGKLLVEHDPLAKRAHGHMQAGSLSGLSIGYSLSSDGWKYDKEKDVFILSKIQLWEVSLVTFPANDQARVTDVKNILHAGELPSPSTVERFLRDAGFSRQQAKTFMSKGYSGLNQRDVDDSNELLADLKTLTEKIRG